jgi:hypothetical protein
VSLDDISKQLCEMKAELKSGLCTGVSVHSLVSTDGVSSESTKSSSSKSTYAQALSKDISQAVMTAVSQSFTAQREEERVCSSVVMHGLYENRTDRNDITDILGLISCQIRPKNVPRIGRTVGSRPRPVRIEMFSPADSNAILSSASALQRYSSTKHLRLSPWLSEQDMEKVRAARKTLQRIERRCLTQSQWHQAVRRGQWRDQSQG